MHWSYCVTEDRNLHLQDFFRWTHTCDSDTRNNTSVLRPHFFEYHIDRDTGGAN